MDFKQLQNRALEIRRKYSDLEKMKYGKEWTREQIVQGFVGDVGDLVKLIMAKDGVREVEDVDEKLAHELADCLYSILVIANKYGVDIEEEFLKTMNELEERISTR
ncbi:MAG: MazG nucleotide pyrophosphohydrolase [Candidatus Woesebacteria bacterium GW2011_GWA1_39_21]|uniref:MazG nucleotide pyrophosphohydrolase n=1 Tax=Candidatus Woesebacteria bacterium GW2011_GWA1_39_21 TaxID=1618550 RepID=A0A0G0N6U8_9BACT|nr:MAG: MazG nucleotide pyrophosphohydrolase [Candidatus Woesebacteria bacterium GW2011_GWA1_39_21]